MKTLRESSRMEWLAYALLVALTLLPLVPGAFNH